MAGSYLCALFGAAILGIYVLGYSIVESGALSNFYLVFYAIIAIHGYLIAKKHEGTDVRKWYTRWWGLIASLLIVATPLLAIRALLFEPFRVPSEAMYPTIKRGSFILASKLGFGNYRLYTLKNFKTFPQRNAKRGDIVVFYVPDSDVMYVKRVVGVGGDNVRYQNRMLYINGDLQLVKEVGRDADYAYESESVGSKAYRVSHLLAAPSYDIEASVPEGMLFVIGDNRENSKDSRHFGPIPHDSVIGKVLFLD